MCRPVPLISEKSTCWLSIQTRPAAFGSIRVGSPPPIGTVHVSHVARPAALGERCVYATRDPSGVNTGA